MTELRLHPAARLELLAAARFYREQSPGLGRSFVSEFRSTVIRVLEFPESGSSRAVGARRLLFPRFPFSLVNAPGEEFIEVLAVMHQRRRPDYWRHRQE